jgi:hypothetical protein
MGARWLQQKLRKQRMRRAHLRMYRAHNVKPKGISIAKDYGDLASWYTIGARGKAARSTEPLPQTKNLKVVRIDDTTVVLDKVWQGLIRHQGVDGFNQVIIDNTKYFKIKMFFSGQQYFFVEEDVLLNTLRRSITYHTRQMAMLSYKRKRITWIEKMPLSTDPSRATGLSPA